MIRAQQRATLVSIALALGSPLSLLAQASLSHKRVTVAATNDEWTPTQLNVAPGDILLVLARGRIRVGQNYGEVGPNGTATGAGALYLKIGVGAGQRVGEKAFLLPDQGGQVKLRVNDNRYDDNAGSFEVSVILIPAAAIPEPSGATPDVRPGSMSVPNAQLAPVPSPGLERAYRAAMRSDLRNLVTAEEAFFADSVKYTEKVGAGGLTYSLTEGNQLLSLALTQDGWTAKIGSVHTRTVCAIYVGSTSIPPATKEGEPACQ